MKQTLQILLVYLFLVFPEYTISQEDNSWNDYSKQLQQLRQLRRASSDTASTYGEQLLKAAKQNGILWLESEVELELARIFFNKGNQTTALQKALRSNELASSTSSFSYTQAPLFVSFIYNRQGKSDAAMKMALVALKRAEKDGDKRDVAASCLIIADIYRETLNSSKALPYAKQALQSSYNIKDSFNIVTSFSTLANIYSNSDFRTPLLLDSALFYLEKVFQWPFSKQLRSYDSARNYINLGRLFRLKENYLKASENYEKAERIIQERKFVPLQQFLNNERISWNIHQKNYQVAIQLAEKNLESFGSGNVNLMRRKEMLQQLQELYETKGNYNDALVLYKITGDLKDSLLNVSKQRVMFELEKKYEQDKKLLIEKNRADLANQQKKYTLIGAIIIIAFLIILTGVLYFKKRQEKALFQMMQSEIHHRISNHLQLVTSIVHSESKESEMNDLLLLRSKISQKIKSIANIHQLLQKSPSVQYIPIQLFFKELIQAQENLHVSKKIEWELDCPNRWILADHATLLGMVLVEWINNTIKYAHSENNLVPVFLRVIQIENDHLQIHYADKSLVVSHIDRANSSSKMGQVFIDKIAKQLDGKYEFRITPKGFECQLILKTNMYEKIPN